MLKPQNITKPNPWEDIDKIRFKFTSDKHGIMHCQNIITGDTETSTVYIVNEASNYGIGFDQKRYDKGVEDFHNWEKGQKKTADHRYKDRIDKSETNTFVWIWQYAVESADGTIYVFVGRTLYDMYIFVNRLMHEMKRQARFGFKSKDRAKETTIAMAAKKNVMAMWYFHNLSYDYQFMRNIFEGDFIAKTKKQKVFARKPRKPMKVKFAIGNTLYVEIRDTLVLTQKSLDAWCHDSNLPVKKKPPIDYLAIMTPETEVSDEQMEYCIADVVSMVYGIDQYRDKFDTLENIPLTQTGIARRKITNAMYMMEREWCEQQHYVMTTCSHEMFQKLCKVFQGGYSHGNAKMIKKGIIEDCHAFDFASAHPNQIVTRTFPITPFEPADPSEFEWLSSQDIYHADFHWFALIKFNYVSAKQANKYWSISKCTDIQGWPIVDNGRLDTCRSCTAYMTDLDFDIFKKAYYFDSYEVIELYTSEAGRMPKTLIEMVLGDYAIKTALKNVAGEETKFIESKQMVNGGYYGTSVTKLISPEIEFISDDRLDDEDKAKFILANDGDTGWFEKECDDDTYENTISKLTPKQVFMSFQCGCWIPAWTRHELWTFYTHKNSKGQYLGNYIAYGDTDSIKGPFTDEDMNFVEEYNKHLADLQTEIAHDLGIDPNKFTPLSKDGVPKRIGIMEREPDCRLRVLQAKRYAYQTTDGKIKTVVAGLPKNSGPKLIKNLEDFNPDTKWNTEQSGKTTAEYNDNQTPCWVKDINGNLYYTEERYGVALVPITFDMSITDDFVHFLSLLLGDTDNTDEFFTDIPKQYR